MWIYDLTNHSMVEFTIVIALATMTYIETNLCKLHPMNKQVFNDFISDK